VELCALGSATIEGLSAFLDSNAGRLAVFGYVSVHAPAREARSRWPDVGPYLTGLPNLVDTVVVHPDLVDETAIECLGPLGSRLCFENMDCTKETGRLPGQLEEVFASFPDAGFCLDVAHVWTNDRSLGLGSALLERFGDRLRQVHLSGIDDHAVHRLLTPDDLDLYAPLLELCSHVPIVLESRYQP